MMEKNINNILKIFIVLFLLTISNKMVQASFLDYKLRDTKSSQHTLSKFDGIIYKDTANFSLSKSEGIKVYNFNDNNTLTINSYGLKLIVKEESQDSYTLLVMRNNKLILSKKQIKGISKVFIGENHLLFSIFTYADEDGNNEGFGYTIDLNNNKVKVFSKHLKNTCNPIMMNNNFYFIDGLNFIKTDLDFKIKNNLKIVYFNKNKKKDFTYLDSYLISRLSKQDYTKLIIDFSPNKSKEKCNPYCGNVDSSSKVLLLK